MAAAPLRETTQRLCASAVLALALLLLNGCKDKNRYVAPPPPKVTVAAPVQRAITRYLETTGSATAINTIDLVARVEGFLQDISYKDGSLVKKGDAMFTIEPLPYQAKLQQAQAAEQGAQAQLTQLSAEYDRQSRLGRSDFSSQSSVDQARAARDAAQSALDQDKANTQLAAINYTYTRVTAPIDGVASAHLASVGELVGTSPTKLATIVQFNPIWVNFNISEQDVLRIRRILAASGKKMEDVGSVPVEVGLEGETGYPHKGTLDYINPGLDPATGTLAVRAIFENANRALLPGFFVRVRLPLQRDIQALLVPDIALGSDQSGRYVLVVNSDSVVEQRRVDVGPTDGEMRVIESGLNPVDRVIVDGTQRAAPGEKVDPHSQSAASK